MFTFVSVTSWGYGDCTGQNILYAGNDLTEATKRLTNFVFPDSSNNYGWIETWENGKEIKHEYIRE